MADPITVDDSLDSSIIYSPSPAWLLGGVSQELDGTTHGTNTPGATATLTFNGTSVQVFGTIGIANPNNTNNPMSTYNIDGSTIATFTGQPSPSITQYRMQFFKSHPLKSEEHTLVVTNTGDKGFFFLDYIHLNFPPPTTATTSSITTAGLSTTAPTVSQSPDVVSPHSVNISTGALIGAVIGAVIPLLIIIIFLIWYLRRRVMNLKRLIDTEREQKVMASSLGASDMPGSESA